MLDIKLSEVAELCQGTAYLPDNTGKLVTEDKITGVTLDSRKVEPGFVFVATRGERVDGHDFINEVFEKGAVGVICEKLPGNYKELSGVCVLVEDSVTALKQMALSYREKLGEKVKFVGITGSVGKTSTKEFVAGVLGQSFKVHKTRGNQNNQIGVPLEILSITPDIDIAVLEMGISEFGEMEKLSALVRPDVALITNIGECHLENLIDRDGVLKAKTAVFNSMSEQGYAVLNGFDDKLCTVGNVKGRQPLRFGNECDNAYASDIVDNGLLGSDVTIHVKGVKNCNDMSFKVHVPLPGKHMIINALAATVVGILFGMDTAAIKQGIEGVQATQGRSNVIASKKYVVVDDCYNANPTSMRAAIDMLKEAKGRTVAVLGDMFELGKDTALLHRKTGTYAAQKGIDVIVCVGELAKNMYEGAVEAADMSKCLYFENKELLTEVIDDIFMKDDTILVKASNGMHFNTIVEELIKE